MSDPSSHSADLDEALAAVLRGFAERTPPVVVPVARLETALAAGPAPHLDRAGP